MKLVLIYGGQAVGKMTVGQELTKITDLKLFHNHMSIEPFIEIFGNRNGQVVKDFRESVFKNFAKTDNYGLIFTFVWDLDSKDDWKYMKHLQKIFKKADIYYVELVSPLEVRLERNKTENRLKNKASKRDVQASENRILDEKDKHRVVSFDGEIKYKNYIKIDNSKLSAEETAKIIKDKFNL